MLSWKIKKYPAKTLLKDELINVKLFDNHSFQFILDRELERRLKIKLYEQDKN